MYLLRTHRTFVSITVQKCTVLDLLFLRVFTLAWGCCHRLLYSQRRQSTTVCFNPKQVAHLRTGVYAQHTTIDTNIRPNTNITPFQASLTSAMFKPNYESSPSPARAPGYDSSYVRPQFSSCKTSSLSLSFQRTFFVPNRPPSSLPISRPSGEHIRAHLRRPIPSFVTLRPWTFSR